MGRQINFYMTPKDERDFIEFVKHTGNVSILSDTSSTEEFQEIDTLPERLSAPSWWSVWFYNRDINHKPVMQYVPQQNHYVIERFKSSVIEFSRSFIKGNVMRAGRVWAEFKFYDAQGRVMAKDSAFGKWFDQITKWIRRNYVYVDSLTYAGPGAMVFRAEGGEWETLAGQRQEVQTSVVR